VKKSELEQIIREEIEEVLSEKNLRQGFQFFKQLFSKFGKQQAKSTTVPAISRQLPMDKITLFNKIKKIEVHQPKLDDVGRPVGQDISKIDSDQAINWINQTLAKFKGRYGFIEADLLAGQRRTFKLADVGDKNLEGAQLILKHMGPKGVEPLKIKAVIQKVPLDPRGKRLPATDVHLRKAKQPPGPRYPGDPLAKPSNWSWRKGQSGKGPFTFPNNP
jgi:hypothetical protein